MSNCSRCRWLTLRPIVEVFYIISVAPYKKETALWWSVLIVTLSLLKKLFGFYLLVVVWHIFILCLTIFSIFSSPGVYGDVIRVKIMFNKKENALIQMSDGTQAQLGEGLHVLLNHIFLNYLMQATYGVQVTI